MTDVSKPTILDNCRDEALEALIEKFDKAAQQSDASSLEVIVAAAAFATVIAAEYIDDPSERTAIAEFAVRNRNDPSEV
jgi:hypothetical protein